MNENIEVISPYLWAVDFNLLPFIKEIYYEGKLNASIEDDFGFITKQKIFVLNKINKFYPKLKELLPKMMNKPKAILKMEYHKLSHKNRRTVDEEIYHIMIRVELRRRKERGDLYNGND